MCCARDMQAGWKMPITFNLTNCFSYVPFKPYLVQIRRWVFILIA